MVSSKETRTDTQKKRERCTLVQSLVLSRTVYSLPFLPCWISDIVKLPAHRAGTRDRKNRRTGSPATASSVAENSAKAPFNQVFILLSFPLAEARQNHAPAIVFVQNNGIRALLME